MELADSSPSGVVPGDVGMLMAAPQFRGSVSSNLAFRLDLLERLKKQTGWEGTSQDLGR